MYVSRSMTNLPANSNHVNKVITVTFQNILLLIQPLFALAANMRVKKEWNNLKLIETWHIYLTPIC